MRHLKIPMGTESKIWALALLALTLPVEGQRTQRPNAPQQDEDRVTSITDLISPLEWRAHGTENLTISGGAGISVTNVGQAGEVPFGQTATYNNWEVKISAAYTGTGWAERFYFSEPIPKPTTPRPLLVFNHRFGKTNLDIAVSTSYLDEAAARGWYVLAPIAASNKHFLSEPAQLNTEFVLDWISNNPAYTIDMNRVYGIGFSMGGGMVVNYAARHVDPSRPMYAAIVNHTGDISLKHVYDNENPQGQFVLDFWFGDGTPMSADPVEMQRKSAIDFDPVAGQFLTDADMVRNIIYLPLKMVRASDDLIDYLEIQTDQLDSHLQTKYGYVNGTSHYQYDIIPFNGHDWSMLDEVQALDFLSQHTLQLPTSGQVLADRNAKWFYFTTTLGDVDENGAFTWSVDGLGNTISLTDTANLSALTVDTQTSGLDSMAPLTLTVGALPGEMKTDIFLRNYDVTVPTQVLLDGQPTTSWQIVEGLLRLGAPDSATHTWQILP